MSAIVLRVLLFLLPFVLFWLLIKFVRGRRRTTAGASDPATLAAEEAREEAREERRAWVFIASLVLIIGGVLTALLLTSRGGDRDQIYIPPRVEDGRVVPGRFVDPEEAAQEATDPPPGGQTDEHGQPDRR